MAAATTKAAAEEKALETTAAPLPTASLMGSEIVKKHLI